MTQNKTRFLSGYASGSRKTLATIRRLSGFIRRQHLSYKNVKYRRLSYKNFKYRRLSYKNFKYRRLSYKNFKYRRLSYKNFKYRRLSYKNFKYRRLCGKILAYLITTLQDSFKVPAKSCKIADLNRLG